MFDGHVCGVLVAVAVQADLVSCVAHLCAFLWEGLKRVTGDEPCCFDVVFLEHLEETRGADMAGKEAYMGVSPGFSTERSSPVQQKHVRTRCSYRD